MLNAIELEGEFRHDNRTDTSEEDIESQEGEGFVDSEKPNSSAWTKSESKSKNEKFFAQSKRSSFEDEYDDAKIDGTDEDGFPESGLEEWSSLSDDSFDAYEDEYKELSQKPHINEYEQYRMDQDYRLLVGRVRPSSSHYNFYF